jgi:hypothetical protein
MRLPALLQAWLSGTEFAGAVAYQLAFFAGRDIEEGEELTYRCIRCWRRARAAHGLADGACACFSQHVSTDASKPLPSA